MSQEELQAGQPAADENSTGSSVSSRGGANVSRRAFTIGIGSTVALLGLGALKFTPAEALVRPPGGSDEDALLSKCNHCNRCIGVCPYNIILPQELDKGFIGMRLPYMSFSRNTPGLLDSLQYCDFCTRENGGHPRCVQVCPTGALELPDDFSPDTCVIGKAQLDTSLCMAYRSGYCAYCHDACAQVRGENAAISYVGSADSASLLPVVNTDLCNGCGACESVCVSTQAGSAIDINRRAIVVVPLEQD